MRKYMQICRNSYKYVKILGSREAWHPEAPRRFPGGSQDLPRRPLFPPKGSFAEFEPLCSDLSVSTDRAKCGQAWPRPKMPRTYPCSLTCSQNGNREPTKLRLWEKQLLVSIGPFEGLNRAQ